MQNGCASCENADKSDLLSAAECCERITEELPLWSYEYNVSQTVTTSHQQAAGTVAAGTADVGTASNTTDALGKNTLAKAELMPCLRRTFVAKNFQAALDFLNASGKLAEKLGHHPDLHIVSYRTVVVEVYTHSIGGVT